MKRYYREICMKVLTVIRIHKIIELKIRNPLKCEELVPKLKMSH